MEFLSLALVFVSVWWLLAVPWRCWGSCNGAVPLRLQERSRCSALSVLFLADRGGEEVEKGRVPACFRSEVRAESGEWCALEGSGSSRPDLERVELGVCRRLLFVRVRDPVLWDWWLLQLFKAPGLGVVLAPRFVVDGAFFGGVLAKGAPVRWREVDEDEDEDSQWFFLLYPFGLCLFLFPFLCCILATR
jgi:hypothetical protein